jgi:hypothetical protein
MTMRSNATTKPLMMAALIVVLARFATAATSGAADDATDVSGL